MVIKRKIIIIASILTYLFLAFGLHNFPPALNADEAAFGYNAYSILKTGKDEYGVFLPLRLKSFGDYKLPLYSYLSIPLVRIFGLTEFSTRLLAKLVGLGLILLIYQLTKQVFKKESIALITLVLAVVSPWIYLFSNQTHETGLATLFVGISILFLLRFSQKPSWSNWIWSFLFSNLSLFTYHSAKILVPFVFLYQLILLWQHRHEIKLKPAKTNWLILVTAFLIFFSFVASELKLPATRVKNLLLFSHQTISLITNEASLEARFSPYGQKLFIDLREFLNRYYAYFSPEFLVSRGDINVRFGFPGVTVINYLDYLFFLVGLFVFLCSKPRLNRLFLLPLLVAPLAGALSWQEYSLSRTHAMILSFLPLIGFGYYQVVKKKKWLGYGLIFVSVFLSLCSIYFLQVHYPKRALVIRAWQSGYHELVDYTKTTYSKTNHFYITNKNGQPYIFFLFYLNYPLQQYQQQAQLFGSDEYGFGHVDNFDKYTFKFSQPQIKQNNIYVGFPDDFTQKELDNLRFKDIRFGRETIFKITD